MTDKRIQDLDSPLPLSSTDLFEVEQELSPESVKVTLNELAQAIRSLLSGAGNGFNADLLDGQHGSFYLNAANIASGILPIPRGGTGIGTLTANTFLFAVDSSTLGFKTAPELKDFIDLDNVDNTSDLDKPISTATQTALNGKENTGVAAGLVTAHELAADPHPQYLTSTEADLAYRKNTDDVPWADLSDIPTEFPPQAHTHVVSDITDIEDYVQDAISTRSFASTGLISGGLVTINDLDSAKFDVTEITAIFVDYTDPESPISTIITAGPFISEILTNLATDTVTHIGLNVSGNLVQQTEEFTPTQRRNIVSLADIYHPNNTTISIISDDVATILSPSNQTQDILDSIGALNIEGNIYSYNGTNLNINKSAGKIFRHGSNFHVDSENPHITSVPAQTSLSFSYRLRNSMEYSPTVSIDPSNYDNSGVLTSVPNNKYTTQHIYILPSGQTVIQYGQTVFDKMVDAQNEIGTETFEIEHHVGHHAVLRCYLIVKQGATDLSDPSQAKFIIVSKFGAASGNGAGGVTYDSIVDALGYVPVEDAPIDSTPYARQDGAWVPVSASSIVDRHITFDGQGAIIPVGTRAYVRFNFACTITKISIFSPTGNTSIQFDFWKDTWANSPPTALDSIVGSTIPSLVATDKYEDVALTGWDTTINSGDMIAINVDSSSATKIIVIITVEQ